MLWDQPFPLANYNKTNAWNAVQELIGEPLQHQSFVLTVSIEDDTDRSHLFLWYLCCRVSINLRED